MRREKAFIDEINARAEANKKRQEEEQKRQHPDVVDEDSEGHQAEFGDHAEAGE